MKSNKEILVSYCPPVTKNGRLLLDKDGNAVRPSTGHKFNIMSLYDLLFKVHPLSKMSPNAVKGSEGEIYAYLAPCLGIEKARQQKKNYSDGLLFIDIDHLPKDDIETIFNAFDDICRRMPNVLTCFYSNSYNDTNKPYSGLHFIVKGDDKVLEEVEYKELNTMLSGVLAWSIYDACGVDVRPSLIVFEGKVESCGLDTHSKNIVQRFYLNYSPVRWNDKCQSYKIHFDMEFMEGWFNEKLNDLEVRMKNNPSLYGMASDTDIYQSINKLRWFKKISDIKITSCKIKSIDTTEWKSLYETDPDKCRFNYLSYDNRYKIANFLQAKTDWSEEDMIIFIFALCGPKDRRDGDAALINGIRQNVMAGRHWRANGENYPSNYAAYVVRLLEQVGININAEIETTYQPIDYKYDSNFEVVYEQMKDYQPVKKPAVDVFRIFLKADEYLTDYKFEITEKIYQHCMTYLVADCMVGKTTFGLNMKSDYGLFNSDDFVAHFHGDTIDLCVPYNSVARNKAKGKSVKRVKTADLSKFSLDKRNVYIWNTVMPLYEQYFKSGLVKRLVLFFDESQKIVTDDYRWKTVFEMFKVLPEMYTHFVFMTGTPAGELEYLKQYFPDYCVIKVDKDIDYKRECKILKYQKFGLGDMIKVIEDEIADGRLPLIYANAKNSQWKLAVKKLNAKRVEEGLKPLRVCTYDRPNADNLTEVDEKKSIKNYDIVIATKYCSVGIDFIKDDRRMRTAIIDYANEIDCTFHDIWQFTLRNREQDTITKIIVHDNEMYYNKLFNYWYYVRLCNEMAKMHTHISKRPELLTDMDVQNFDFIQEVFQLRKFGQLVDGKHKDNYFTDERNVKLLATYYLYVKIFSNINIIKHMLERRGVTVSEIDMDHVVEKMDYTDKKSIYKGFIDNFKDISAINTAKGQYDERSYQIDINDRTKPALYIEDNKIYSANKHYTDWLIGQFAGKDEWLPILQDQEYITKETFASYRRMIMIAVRISEKEIDYIKRHAPVMNEDDIEKKAVELVEKHYVEILRNETDKWKTTIIKDVIEDYKKIIRFMVDNVEFIEEIKNATSDGQKLTACHKMQIVIRQKQNELARKKMSLAATKGNSKSITVRWIKNGNTKTFDSMKEAADYLKVSTKTFRNWVRSQNGRFSKVIQLIEPE